MLMNNNCPCKKKKCERHGNCAACRDHHAEKQRRYPVACEKGKNESEKILKNQQ